MGAVQRHEQSIRCHDHASQKKELEYISIVEALAQMPGVTVERHGAGRNYISLMAQY